MTPEQAKELNEKISKALSDCHDLVMTMQSMNVSKRQQKRAKLAMYHTMMLMTQVLEEGALQ